MSLSAKLRRAPLRAASGLFILNSGVGKLTADDDTAKKLHGMATNTYPFLERIDAKVFARGLAVGEVAIGGALLLPVVPAVVAGAALVGFSGGLLGLYWRTPGLHEEGSPRPTQQGIPIAKDVWLFGIGAGLLADGLLEPAHDKKIAVGAAVAERQASGKRRARRRARRLAGRQARAEQVAQMKEAANRLAEARTAYAPVVAEKAAQAKATGRRLGRRGRRLAEDYGPVAAEKAQQAVQQARAKGQQLAEDYGPVAAEKAQQVAQQAVQQARAKGQQLAEDYGPVVAEKAQQVRRAAQEAREHISS